MKWGNDDKWQIIELPKDWGVDSWEFQWDGLL